MNNFEAHILVVDDDDGIRTINDVASSQCMWNKGTMALGPFIRKID